MNGTIRLKLKSKVNSKLAFVKIVKEYTSWGLRDAKDFADNLFSDFENKRDRFSELKLENPQNYSSFVNSMKDIGVDAYITGGVQWNRDFKMLSLGIGEKEDYINFISECIQSMPYGENRILEMALSMLDKDQLNDIVNKIKKEYDSSL